MSVHPEILRPEFHDVRLRAGTIISRTSLCPVTILELNLFTKRIQDQQSNQGKN